MSVYLSNAVLSEKVVKDEKKVLDFISSHYAITILHENAFLKNGNQVLGEVDAFGLLNNQGVLIETKSIHYSNVVKNYIKGLKQLEKNSSILLNNSLFDVSFCMLACCVRGKFDTTLFEIWCVFMFDVGVQELMYNEYIAQENGEFVVYTPSEMFSSKYGHKIKKSIDNSIDFM